MASKSKRAQMSPSRNTSRAFMYWSIAVLIVKIAIIIKNIFSIKPMIFFTFMFILE